VNVLDVFKARWEAAGLPSFIEVVNTQVTTDQVPPTWGTAFLDSTSRDDLTMGSRPWIMEEGNVVAVLFCKSGEGRAILMPAVELLRTTFHGWQTPQSADEVLHFVNVIGPAGDQPEGDGEWFRQTFLVPYRQSLRRVEPPA
jgi:hypothetical protein